ncbi:tRNA dihydrouridine synthase [Leucothrix pacifica]|uniref:tRNA-dihydrouridine(16) synthase n=1 Tax=Leucothrix pacifica TaxID=1247513 RepID=A0A317CKY9_9GAMM|nr:tRNA-dihydrouridine synthase [Leucothrix pacifica]PWQ97022.1 tRNA dihydrouridine(16) synthase DusC [Leucothrix pacifica]
MRILLAPMEGVVDYEMRALLTQIGGYDRCVTEFVRVTDQLLPNRVFLRFNPELEQGGTTPSGVPVYLQLLGGSAKYMGINAARAQKLEPPGIDINFGCPSKTVNKSDGGSVLLKEPHRIGDIVKSVRDSVDPAIPVTAKIRLGFSHHDFLAEVAGNIEEAGASEVCIHARTKEDGYKPPAYWSAVKQVSEQSSIPVIINGEIWTVADAHRARAESGCSDIMLGRSALTRPDLAAAIKADNNADSRFVWRSWPEVLEILIHYLERSESQHPKFVSNRSKQWLVFLQRAYPEAATLFQNIKRLKESEDVFNALSASLKQLA